MAVDLVFRQRGNLKNTERLRSCLNLVAVCCNAGLTVVYALDHHMHDYARTTSHHILVSLNMAGEGVLDTDDPVSVATAKMS